MTTSGEVTGAVGARRTRPVMAWALVGAAFVALQVYVYAAWLLSAPTRTGPGADAQPWYMDVGVAFMNVGMPIGAAFVVVWYVIRPWRRDGRLSPDGLFALALIGVAWQDPLVNYTQVTATYNANIWNLGSWGAHVPGWLSPRGGFAAEPITGFIPAYLFTAFMIVLVTDRLMRRARDRWPRIGTFGLIAVAFGVNVVLGLFAELLSLRIGLFSYPGAIRSLSLFPGTYYQLPLYETALNAFLLGGFACLFHFRNARGETVAERGIDDVRTGPRRQTGLRLLALVGAMNAIFLVYNVGWSWFTVHQDPWPKDTISRSYLVDDFCGPGTEYACPGPEVPIPHGDSGHVGSDGEFVPADDSG